MATRAHPCISWWQALRNSLTRACVCASLCPLFAHQVLDVSWKGDQLWGTIEVLPTPSGLLLWELYSRVGCALVWAGRGALVGWCAGTGLVGAHT